MARRLTAERSKLGGLDQAGRAALEIDPFGTFVEWRSGADRRAFHDLRKRRLEKSRAFAPLAPRE